MRGSCFIYNHEYFNTDEINLMIFEVQIGFHD